ncbi:1-aminocyclopropane-1-carboxylate deaminase/D-cysteine desulfhydrase [Crocinitomix algicola]|uniref:1-aminocyclopropane-1-carboxylate deaminase/D-cysteine desulfhydrase n=1 Tax=Crocinitomix algicola TaxID=1740263 RepID=UPI00087310E0|nr:pyridoxal-phosphate dependent enzyme [Crocinitomix algicola]
MHLNIPSPVELLSHPLFEENLIEVYVKRDDLIHPEISGNKWRKLKLNIERVHSGRYEGILSFGGAYSNHISALASVGKALNIPTIGIIRGDELNAKSNSTLAKASELGMKLVFVSREEYGWRYEKDYKNQLRIRFGNYLIVEEGGANFYGALGCTEILSEVNFPVDHIFLAAGTGTTTAGILIGNHEAKVTCVPVFKNGGFIRDDIKELLIFSGLDDEAVNEKLEQLNLDLSAHFGGYGKYNQDLIDFINTFYRETHLKLDQVYTGKMFYALVEAIKRGSINRGEKVLAIHTGGLQGTLSIAERLNFSV